MFIIFMLCTFFFTQYDLVMNRYKILEIKYSTDLECTISLPKNDYFKEDMERMTLNIVLKNNSGETLYISNVIREDDMGLFRVYRNLFPEEELIFSITYNTFLEIRNDRDKILSYAVISDSFMEFGKDEFVKVCSNDSITIEYKMNIIKDFDLSGGSYTLSIIYLNCDLGDNWGFVPWTGMVRSNSIDFKVLE